MIQQIRISPEFTNMNAENSISEVHPKPPALGSNLHVNHHAEFIKDLATHVGPRNNRICQVWLGRIVEMRLEQADDQSTAHQQPIVSQQRNVFEMKSTYKCPRNQPVFIRRARNVRLLSWRSNSSRCGHQRQ